MTLSYALNDSPAGLAGWIVEKFRSWSDCGGDVERKFITLNDGLKCLLAIILPLSKPLIFTFIMLGATFEAFLYYYKTLKLWQFTEKIVNWEKVEQIANKIESL